MIAIWPTATGVSVMWSVCPYVTLVHPAKTVGCKAMPFGRDSRGVPSNIVLGALVPP